MLGNSLSQPVVMRSVKLFLKIHVLLYVQWTHISFLRHVINHLACESQNFNRITSVMVYVILFVFIIKSILSLDMYV